MGLDRVLLDQVHCEFSLSLTLCTLEDVFGKSSFNEG